MDPMDPMAMPPLPPDHVDEGDGFEDAVDPVFDRPDDDGLFDVVGVVDAVDLVAPPEPVGGDFGGGGVEPLTMEEFDALDEHARLHVLEQTATELGAPPSVLDAIRAADGERHGDIYEALTKYDSYARSTFFQLTMNVPSADAFFGGDVAVGPDGEHDEPVVFDGDDPLSRDEFLALDEPARLAILERTATEAGAPASVLAAIRAADGSMHGQLHTAFTYDPYARSTLLQLTLDLPQADTVFGVDEAAGAGGVITVVTGLPPIGIDDDGVAEIVAGGAVVDAQPGLPGDAVVGGAVPGGGLPGGAVPGGGLPGGVVDGGGGPGAAVPGGGLPGGVVDGGAGAGGALPGGGLPGGVVDGGAGPGGGLPGGVVDGGAGPGGALPGGGLPGGVAEAGAAGAGEVGAGAAGAGAAGAGAVGTGAAGAGAVGTGEAGAGAAGAGGAGTGGSTAEGASTGSGAPASGAGTSGGAASPGTDKPVGGTPLAGGVPAGAPAGGGAAGAPAGNVSSGAGTANVPAASPGAPPATSGALPDLPPPVEVGAPFVGDATSPPVDLSMPAVPGDPGDDASVPPPSASMPPGGFPALPDGDTGPAEPELGTLASVSRVLDAAAGTAATIVGGAVAGAAAGAAAATRKALRDRSEAEDRADDTKTPTPEEAKPEADKPE